MIQKSNLKNASDKELICKRALFQYYHLTNLLKVERLIVKLIPCMN